MCLNQIRLDPNDNRPSEAVTMSINDLQELAELALCACQSCPQKEAVAACQYRAVLHRIGIPVARTEVTPLQCEFRHNDEAHCEPPQAFHIIREDVY